MISKYKRTGWHNESARHSLAAKGVRTKINYARDIEIPGIDYASKKDKGLGRHGFKSAFTYKLGNVPMKMNVRLNHLNSEDILHIPQVVMRDKDGLEVQYVRIDEQTGKKIEKLKFVFMNSKGQMIRPDEIIYYVVDDKGKEKEVKQFESNVGGGKLLPTENMVSADEGEKFLVEKVYEMVGETVEDDASLFAVAEDLEKKNQIAVVPIVLRKSFKKYWGLVTPVRVGKDKFSMLVRMGRTKIMPEQPMDIKQKEKQLKKTAPELTVASPF